MKTLKCLSSIEKALLNKLRVIEICGKRRRKVPILLRSIHYDSIQLLLLLHRGKTTVDKRNLHIFARPSHGVFTPLDACKVIREYVTKTELKFPTLMTSTKLRKHIGTLSQLLDLSGELQQLCNFIGHRYAYI